MKNRFPRLARLAAAAWKGDPDELARAARSCLDKEGPRAVREVLLQLHLFGGFPRMVRALTLLASIPPPQEPAGGPPDAGGQPDDGDQGMGLILFRRLYGNDADAVLEHLRNLDPALPAWILGHAYGRVLSRPGLPVEDRERLALLALAATGCWKQWGSHARIARRLGIPAALLAEDLDRTDWLTSGQRAKARSALSSGDVPSGA
ncbi:MAG: carboxymuconolactone decarboxylase family protein [Planctomycetota bacterium]